MKTLAIFLFLCGPVGAATCSTPTFAPTGSTTVRNGTVITMSSTCTTICSTINGTTPAATTPGTCSTGAAGATRAIVQSGGVANRTLKAIGTQSGNTNSAVQSVTFNLTIYHRITGSFFIRRIFSLPPGL